MRKRTHYNLFVEANYLEINKRNVNPILKNKIISKIGNKLNFGINKTRLLV